ncbi:hypothetical protein ABH15_09435 [Methanoculleus taiwanensis]|uniref:Uncharacterized protein n=1 Tax=Methanoculleus taiwanensis TaxID=1550565 RepID=A0A498H1T8_9EURY|nr:hypothetical protein [Methanoculleus taiwanensis]RXE56325.1 hypothetical protein ABH15_09435 [Methanoculleus taiwanensis]
MDSSTKKPIFNEIINMDNVERMHIVKHKIHQLGDYDSDEERKRNSAYYELLFSMSSGDSIEIIERSQDELPLLKMLSQMMELLKMASGKVIVVELKGTEFIQSN